MALQLQDPIEEKPATAAGSETSSEAASHDSTMLGLSRGKRSRPLFDPPIVRRAILDSFVKLNPATLAKNR